MRVFKILLSFFFIALLFTSASAQTTKLEPLAGEGNYNLFLQIGETFIKKGEYYNAIPYLKKAYSKEKDKMRKAAILFRIAESYRNINDTKAAEEWYAKTVKAGYDNSIVFLRLGEAQKANGDYESALANFKTYKLSNPDDPRGATGVTSCELAKEWVKNPTKHVIENVEALNTKYSDFGLIFSKRNPRLAFFTSSRESATGKLYDGWTGQKYTDLFQSIRDDKGKWSTPQPITAPLNTEFAEGSAVLDRSGNTMFFTKCTPGKTKAGFCNIYISRRRGDLWDIPKPLNMVGDSVTIGHPALSPDERTLYFTSDMPGTIGGRDIWMSLYSVQTRSWSKPINLGPKVNTVGDEMYPYVSSDGTLYFSSNAHVGMGGLDLFKTKFVGSRTPYSYYNNPNNADISSDEEGPGESPILDLNFVIKDTVIAPVDSLSFYAQQWSEPENLKYPINSSYDDFAIVFEEGGPSETGYFSSVREGGKGFDDIYRFHVPPLEFTIQGKVMDIDNRGGIKGASIELLGNDGSIVTVKTDKRGVYIFDKTMVKANTVYKLTALAKDYLSAKGVQSTVGLTESTDLFQDAFLLKSTLKPITIPNILYDYNKATLRPESRISLDSTVIILNDNPKLIVSINAHTDSRGGEDYNIDLSQKRAQSVVDYLTSKGIDPQRLVANGYGKSKPKITEEEINKLSTEAQKEAAHQLNRRTEFEKIRDDYVPKQRFNSTYKDSVGQNIRVSKPILSAKDSAYFNLKKDGKFGEPAKPKQGEPMRSTPEKKQEEEKVTPSAPKKNEDEGFPTPTNQPAKKDTTNEPEVPPVPEY
jgi:peptidoglycan-associated lipoprotein